MTKTQTDPRSKIERLKMEQGHLELALRHGGELPTATRFHLRGKLVEVTAELHRLEKQKL
jgi:hypothetical protein